MWQWHQHQPRASNSCWKDRWCYSLHYGRNLGLLFASSDPLQVDRAHLTHETLQSDITHCPILQYSQPKVFVHNTGNSSAIKTLTPHCSVLQSLTQYYIVLLRNTKSYSVLQSSTKYNKYCQVVFRNTKCCSILQSTTPRCKVLLSTTKNWSVLQSISILHYNVFHLYYRSTTPPFEP